MFSTDDHYYMTQAIELAARGLFSTPPNPRVGCVIVKNNEVIGKGWHIRTGSDHAEINALRDAGDAAAGATVYVSLEPCNHHGLTPPCVDALIDAGVTSVICAMEDPNPTGRGKGLARLREAGIDTRCGLLAAQAWELNPGFVSRMQRSRPWVRMKSAVSLDAMSALPDGSSQWITGSAARTDGHRFRARACAVLTGFGTVRDDDPQLNVRLVDTDRQPLIVVVDAKLQTSAQARLLDNENVLFFCAELVEPAASQLRERGAEIIAIANDSGKVDLAAMFELLALREINEVHVEAGFKLNGSLLREKCVDELLLYVAPCLLGQATGFASLQPVPDLAQRHAFKFVSATPVGDDLRLVARVALASEANATSDVPYVVQTES